MPMDEQSWVLTIEQRIQRVNTVKLHVSNKALTALQHETILSLSHVEPAYTITKFLLKHYKMQYSIYILESVVKVIVKRPIIAMTS